MFTQSIGKKVAKQTKQAKRLTVIAYKKLCKILILDSKLGASM